LPSPGGRGNEVIENIDGVVIAILAELHPETA
jgi:hypothetical protein